MGAVDLYRRRVLTLGAGSLAALATRRAGAAGPAILLAPSTASVLVARAAEALGRDVVVWRSPDELRAALVAGRANTVTLPTSVAANLTARGLPMQLVTIVSAGSMWLLARDPGVARLDDLRGRRVQLYFRHDMPDVALRWLLARRGLSPGRDLTLDYAGTAVETAQLLLAGRADIVLLNEPAASTALLTAEAAGVPLRRAFTLQEAWAAATGDPTPLPMAGLAVTAACARDDLHAVRALHRATVAAADWARREPAAAGRLSAQRLGFRAEAATLALSAADISVEPAVAVRPAIESFLAALAELSPGLIGGRLPADDFYAPI